MLNVSLFFLTYICEGKSDIRQNLVRYQSDLGHFRSKNLTYFKDFQRLQDRSLNKTSGRGQLWGPAPKSKMATMLLE